MWWRNCSEIIGLPDQNIIETIGMAELPLILFVFHKKYNGQVELIDIGGDCMFRYSQTNVANVSYLATHVHFITISKNRLRIEGNVSWPTVLKEQFEFYVSVNGKQYACDMFDAGFDLRFQNEIYETRTAFRLELELEQNDDYEIKFIYRCAGIECVSGKTNYMRFSPVADNVERQYATRAGWLIWVEKEKLYLRHQDEEATIDSYEKKYIASVGSRLKKQDAEYVSRLRATYFERKKTKTKPIWLFCDRIDKADDNGAAFFEYISGREQNDRDCFFVISRKSPDYKRMQSLGNVVDALSDEHCLLLLLADYIVTSQLNGWVENPFGAYEEYFRDLSHQARVVFLQHGVTKDDQTQWLNRYNQNLYAIVTSSQKEQKAFLEYPYFYETKQIWNTGMPRFDKLYSDSQKYILFMPTWRRELMEQKVDTSTGTYKWYLKEHFEESHYYKEYHSILNNRFFLTICRIMGYRILFMPHPIMQPYVDAFQVSDEVIVLPYDTSWRELFAKSRMMVTDYSSVAFDFAYLKKPVIYYQFDGEEFFQSHTYRQGYFDYRTMGFGEIVRTQFELCCAICRYLLTACSMRPKYEKRINDFYTYSDTNACERIYQKLTGETYEL
jgi:CDP-glycerol glycerophosphotransferase (TagB/SpsB family)